jgi:hypothetical protein
MFSLSVILHSDSASLEVESLSMESFLKVAEGVKEGMLLCLGSLVELLLKCLIVPLPPPRLVQRCTQRIWLP